MADAADLKSAAARREGSSPSAPTRFENRKEDNGTIGKGFPSGARTDEVEFRQENVPVARFSGIRPTELAREGSAFAEGKAGATLLLPGLKIGTHFLFVLFCFARNEVFVGRDFFEMSII